MECKSKSEKTGERGERDFVMRRKKLTDEERIAKRKASQEDYRHRVRRFNLQFNLKDMEAREWFELQSDKGEYLKNLILADKAARLKQQS